jgi:hypothetical protein
VVRARRSGNQDPVDRSTQKPKHPRRVRASARH